MRKVLFIMNEPLNRGGSQHVIMSIVRSLHTEYQFDIILCNTIQGYYDKEFESYGGRIIRLPNYEGSSLLIRKIDFYIRHYFKKRALRDIIMSNGPYDVVHCNNGYESSYVLKIAKQLNVPVRLSHAHIIVDNRINILRRLFNSNCLKLIKRYSTNMLGCSAAACKSMYGIDKKNVVIYNSYDEDKFCKLKYDYQINEDLTLIQIGSYSGIKNQIFSIEVFSCILKKIPSAKLYFVGFALDQEYYKKIKNRIIDKSIENSIVFLPSDADSARYLNSSSYLIHPSLHEGLGIVPIEAQSMGVKCFVSDTVPKDVDCGGCTFLSLSLGVEKWADTIMEDYAQTKGAHGEFDCSKFTAEKVADEYRKIYEGKR